jgi:hypothetical protein
LVPAGNAPAVAIQEGRLAISSKPMAGENSIESLPSSPMRHDSARSSGTFAPMQIDGCARALMRSLRTGPDLQAAFKSSDPYIRYLASVMLGFVHESSGRADRAIRYYTDAVAVMPATAASLALASALFRQGKDVEAAQVLARWDEDGRPEDPWRLYGNRDFRLFPRFRDELRAWVGR